MTNQEFSDEFDVLYNNIMSNQAPGLDEYEKSVFLTKALDEIIKSYFLALYNKGQQGFDDNERRLIDFSSLMKTEKVDIASGLDYLKTVPNSMFYLMPNDVLFYINEFINVRRNDLIQKLVVIPLSYTDLNRLMSKPYKRPLKNLAWRIIQSGISTGGTYTNYAGLSKWLANELKVSGGADNIYNTIKGYPIKLSDHSTKLKVGAYYLDTDGKLSSEISNKNVIIETSEVSTVEAFINTLIPASSTRVEVIPGHLDSITEYIVRYVSRPTPIILTDLVDEGVTLGGGKLQAIECRLDPILHQEILQRAVELAKAAYQGDLTSTVQIGNLSATEKGVVTRQ